MGGRWSGTYWVGVGRCYRRDRSIALYYHQARSPVGIDLAGTKISNI